MFSKKTKTNTITCYKPKYLLVSCRSCMYMLYAPGLPMVTTLRL